MHVDVYFQLEDKDSGLMEAPWMAGECADANLLQWIPLGVYFP